MPKPKSVGVYARISSDQEGSGLGVARQLEDCHRLAESLGWAVAEEYVDNDLSAYSGKKRPGYERLLRDVAEGVRDGVVAYHVDRLTRRPIELEQFVETVTAAGVRHVRFVAGGDVDLANGDGLLVVRMLAAVAANESATKSRRVRRKLDEVAAAGRPHGGSNRPFGYEDDRITVRADEAEVIRTLVERFLAGEAVRSLASWLDAEGIRTVRGGPWRTTSIRALLTSPRIAGLRVHRGQVIGKAMWEPIVTETQRARVLALMAQRANTGRRAPRRYLLSGLLRCGRCDNRLYSSARATTRRYVCSSSPDHGGCGRLTVVAEPLEQLITDAVLYRLDTPELADALAGRHHDDEVSVALTDELADDRAQLEELAGLYAAKAITATEWMTARNQIEARITATTRRLHRSNGNDRLASLAGTGADLGAQWGTLSLSRQHAVIAAVLDHAVIAPGSTGARTLDPGRVRPTWRL
jgi:site-specific DNA recombinase